MRLKKIALLDFKNIAQEELALCAGVNCLVGDNGAGKTNVVDAVYYLSMCKSSLQMTDGQSIRHGADFFLIEGQYVSDAGRNEQVVCSCMRKGGKVLKRNGKEYDRLADHVGLIPAVIVSPADGVLISDAADERRRYLNACISQLDKGYLHALMRYNAVLAERNRLLKMQLDETMLAIYDRQLVDHGTIIHERRRTFVERLQPLVESFYRTLSGDREQVALHYKSELNDRPFDEILQAARQKDLVNEFTTAGIHRDDLVLRIADYPLRKYGSQGQQKSFLIALKLAQYRIIADEKAEKPLLLLDDLFDKLDASRVERLIRLVTGDDFGQNPHHRLQSDPPASHSRQGMRPLCAFQRTGRSHYGRTRCSTRGDRCRRKGRHPRKHRILRRSRRSGDRPHRNRKRHRRKRRKNRPTYRTGTMRRTKTMLMGDLLDEFFKRPYVAAKVAEGRLPDTWRAIVGDRAADLTTELRLERHVLYVRIQSSVMRSELFYQRDALRDAINRESGIRLINTVIIR